MPRTAAETFVTSVSARPNAGAWLSIVGLACVLAWIGHRLVFAQFQGYDDEGYLLITVQQFLQGSPLYDDVYTQYGPAYYLWQQLLHGLIGIPVTHDATRVVTVVMWLVCSALAGVPVWLLTRRLLLAVIGMAMTFFHLTQLTYEPGHPQELCLVGVMGVVAVAMWRLLVTRTSGHPGSTGRRSARRDHRAHQGERWWISDRRGDARPLEQPSRCAVAQAAPQSGDVVGIGRGAGSAARRPVPH